MSYNFTVSPDFNPKNLSGWFIFNTWLQKAINEAIHLELYNDFASQRQAIREDKFDLIYANPFDATVLVREKGFLPLVSPSDRADEAIIAVTRESAINAVEDLPGDVRISTTDDHDVNMMCMLMLEPADINKEGARIRQRDSYVLIAKDLLQGDADIGFFLEETYQDLSQMIQQRLRPVVQSQIQLIHHVLLVGPRLINRQDEIQQLLVNIKQTEKGRQIVEELGFSSWQAISREETEFMIDLMDTLEAH